MGIFSKKPKYAFSDILKGLQYAINSAREMLQAQQIENLMRFWSKNDGTPVTQKVKIGERDLDVPLILGFGCSSWEQPTSVNIS